MNSNTLKTFKKAIEEIKHNDEIKANILYKDIWQDIIGQFVIVGSTHNTFLCFLDNYTEKVNISENTKRILISKLEKNGFKLGLRKECPKAYGISKDNVLKYINKINSNNKEQQKMPITPAAETRSR